MPRQKPESTNSRLSAEEYRAMAEFRYRIRQYLCFTERTARAANIHPQQHRLMLAIKGVPEGMAPSIRTLAERLQIEHHSAVELVDRAVAGGLVARRPEPKDRRMVRVVVTPKGEKALGLLSMRNKEELRSAAPALVSALRALTRKRKF